MQRALGNGLVDDGLCGLGGMREREIRAGAACEVCEGHHLDLRGARYSPEKSSFVCAWIDCNQPCTCCDWLSMTPSPSQTPVSAKPGEKTRRQTNRALAFSSSGI